MHAQLIFTLKRERLLKGERSWSETDKPVRRRRRRSSLQRVMALIEYKLCASSNYSLLISSRLFDRINFKEEKKRDSDETP